MNSPNVGRPGVTVNLDERAEALYAPEADCAYRMIDVPGARRVIVSPLATAILGLSISTAQVPGEFEVGGTKVTVFSVKEKVTAVGAEILVIADTAGLGTETIVARRATVSIFLIMH